MKKILLTTICFLLFQSLSAQLSQDSQIFQQLKSRDSLLFELGFNLCKIEKFEGFISEDLEFYHDQGGLSTNKEDFLHAVKNNICSNQDQKPIRKLIPGSLEVYPLYENGKLYAAIQKGMHDFYIKEPGKKMYKTSSAKFTHVWILEGKDWILKRVLSYDHQSPEKS